MYIYIYIHISIYMICTCIYIDVSRTLYFFRFSQFRWYSEFYEFADYVVLELYIGLSPFPVIVTTRIISCLVGDSGIPINFHLPLWVGRGTTQIIYTSECLVKKIPLYRCKKEGTNPQKGHPNPQGETKFPSWKICLIPNLDVPGS